MRRMAVHGEMSMHGMDMLEDGMDTPECPEVQEE